MTSKSKPVVPKDTPTSPGGVKETTPGVQKGGGVLKEPSALRSGAPRFSTPGSAAANAAASLAQKQKTPALRKADAVAAALKTRDMLRAKADRFKK